MLDGAARIERDMASHNAGAHGQVRVFASVSTMTESMANDVAAFLKMPSHRTIQVDLEERLSPDVVAGVRDGMASIGVCWDAVDLGALQSRPYRSDHLSLVVPEGHPLAARESIRFEETLDYEHVSLPINSILQLMCQRAAARAGRSLVHRIIVSNFEAATRVIAADLAIGLIPREAADRSTARPGLRMIPLDEPWSERKFVMCFRDANALSPAATKLTEHLERQARN
jgi:DNA-binding transcriptional LysR family regulator